MNEVREKLEFLRQALRISEKEAKIEEIENEMNNPDFWLDDEEAGRKAKELKDLQNEIKDFKSIEDLASLSSDDELSILRPEIEKLEKLLYFSGKYDRNGAILSFFSGAGGVDAQDWTEMLFKMYLHWAEKNDFTAKILDETIGTEAGLKSATFEITGTFAYGKLRGESGVHRLVRQSPFNAKNLRQTSFALVEVMPEIESAASVEIDPKDLRIDVYRSGGHGGQSVNTTDSAVRITHLPTGIVVTCQNERSQLQNKETAMKVLRSRLAKLMIEQHKEKVDEIRGNFSSPEWGNQIRSYVLHPYKMVKDHRTEYESKNPDEVLAGDLEGFIEAEIKWLSGNKK